MTAPEPTLAWLFFSRRGRIARRSFLFSILFLIMPQIVLVNQIVRNEDNESVLAGLGLTMIVLTICTLWSLFVITAKRLHDLGAPSALCLIAFFPGINWLFFLALAILPSSPETNEYGPPPFGN